MNEKSDIIFQNLSFAIKSGCFKKTTKEILKNVSGKFRASQLSAVMGPSGCGKSSLLNILSGYITKNVTGDIKINGFRKQSYIMQEEKLQDLLTVNELMMFAVNFKTQSKSGVKMMKIKNVLENLGLEEHKNSYVKDLSGGQLKRLSIAQELVDDPLILFLDEPTTGLDSSSATICIKLLKKLTLQGRTIICTIHTPSALLFGEFDHIYAMAEGSCIYQGSCLNLVPFLSDCGFVCPESYNPSDFLIEIANDEYGKQNDKLNEQIANGKNESYRGKKPAEAVYNEFEIENLSNLHSSSNFIKQFWYLIVRNFMILYRDKTIMWLQLGLHLIVALFVGGFFINIGSEAGLILGNFKLIYALSMFIIYTGFFSKITISLEFPTVKREVFNKWYSITSYFLAMSIADIPLSMVCTTLVVVIVYTLTGQPMEEFRFTALLLLQIFLGFLAQGFGSMVGSMATLMISLFFATIALPILLLFGGFMITQKDANPIFSWAFDVNFAKQAGDTGLQTILGYNRTTLICGDIYCHFKNPSKFLEFCGVEDEITRKATLKKIFEFFFTTQWWYI